MLSKKEKKLGTGAGTKYTFYVLLLIKLKADFLKPVETEVKYADT